MNEQAINDAYSLFTQNGYKKSIDDFKTLISTNPQALSDAYSLFTQNGYKKSEEDFKVLMGVGATPTELKKKEPTASPSSAGQLPSQKVEAVTEFDQQLLYGPMGLMGLTPTKKRDAETWDNFSKATSANTKTFLASAATAVGEMLDIASTSPLMGVQTPGRDFGTYTRDKMRQLKGEGDEMAGASMRRFAERQKEEASKIEYDADTVTGFLGALVPSTAGVAASIGASYINPALGAGLGYASMATLTASSVGSGIEAYDEYKKENGLESDPAARLGVGILFGAAEALTEKLQLDRYLPGGVSKKAMQTLLKSMPEEVLEKEGADIVKRFASESASNSKLIGDLIETSSKGAISEGATEALTSVVQEASKYAYFEKDDRSNIFSKEFLGEVASSFLGGAVMGAGLGPLSFGSQRVNNNKRRKAAGQVVVGRDSQTNEAVEVVGREGEEYIVVKASGEQSRVPVSRIEGSEVSLSYDAFKNILGGSSAGTAMISEDPDAPQAGESIAFGTGQTTVQKVDPATKTVEVKLPNGSTSTMTFDEYKNIKSKSFAIESLNDGENDFDFVSREGQLASTEAFESEPEATSISALLSMRYPDIEFSVVDRRQGGPTSAPDFRIIGKTKPSAQAQQPASTEPGGTQPVAPEAPQSQPVDQGPAAEVPVETPKAKLPEKTAAKLTEDGQGNYVFHHYSAERRPFIKRSDGTGSRATSREEQRSLSAVGGLAMYYAQEGQLEGMVESRAQHTVTVPKEKVYDADADPLGFIKEARERFEKARPGQAFDDNYRVAFITQVAGDNGFDMVVAKWGGNQLRAQTTKELVPIEGNIQMKPKELEVFNVGDKVKFQGGTYTITEVDGDVLRMDGVDMYGDKQKNVANLKRDRKRLEKIEPEQPKVVKAIAAPFYNTQVTGVSDAAELRQSDGYKAHLETIRQIADVFGIKINQLEDTIGGYQNDAGEKIVELSTVITVAEDTNLDRLEEMAAVLASMAPEVQESTIAGRYVEESDPGYQGDSGIDEFVMQVGDLQGALDSLKAAEIFDFTLNETEGTVTLLDFSKGKDDAITLKLARFVQQLSNRGISYGKQERHTAESRFIDPGRRAEILGRLQKDAVDNAKDQGGTAENRLLDVVNEAIKRDNQYRESKGLPLIPEVAQAAKDVEDSIRKAASTLKLSFPDVTLIVGDNQADIEAKIIEQLTPILGEKRARQSAIDSRDSRGMAIFKEGKPAAVIINKEIADSSTAPHEVWHLVLREAFGKNPKKFKEFRDAIANELINSGYEDIAELLDDFSSQYKDTMTSEEYIAEFGGLLATKGFDPKKLSDGEKTLLQRIKDIINKFSMDLIGKEVFLADAQPENIIQFMSAVSDVIAKGGDVSGLIKTPIDESGSVLTEGDVDVEVTKKISGYNPVNNEFEVEQNIIPKGTKVRGFAFMADRMKTGVWKGLDPKSKIEIPLQGGPGYPMLKNINGVAAWAVEGRHMATRMLNSVSKSDTGNGIVTLMTEYAHLSNLTFTKIFEAEMRWLTESKKISKKEQLELLNRFIEEAVIGKKDLSVKMGVSRATKKIQDINPNAPLRKFAVKKGDSYTPKKYKSVEELFQELDSTFDSRKMFFNAMVDMSLKDPSVKVKKYKFPDMVRVANETMDDRFSGVKAGFAVSVVSFNKDKADQFKNDISSKKDIDETHTADAKGIPAHLSYKYIIDGTSAGWLESPVDMIQSEGINPEDKDFFEKLRADEKSPQGKKSSDVQVKIRMKMPEVEVVTKKTRNVLTESKGLTEKEKGKQGLEEILSAKEKAFRAKLKKAKNQAAKAAREGERTAQQARLKDFMDAKQAVVEGIQALMKQKFMVGGKEVGVPPSTVGQVNKILNQILKGKSLKARYKIDPGGNRVPYISTVEEAISNVMKIIADSVRKDSIDRARANRRVAKNNVKAGKLGVLPTGGSIDQLLQIDPAIVPLAVFDQYMEIINEIGQRKKVLPLEEQGILSQKVQDVLDVVDAENGLLEQLAITYDNYPNKVMVQRTNAAGVTRMSESFSETLKAMVNDGTIKQSEADLMKKRKSEIIPKIPSQRKQPATQAEVDSIVQNILALVSGIPNPGAGFNADQNGILRLFKSLKKEDLDAMAKPKKGADMEVNPQQSYAFTFNKEEIPVEFKGMNPVRGKIETTVKTSRLPWKKGTTTVRMIFSGEQLIKRGLAVEQSTPTVVNVTPVEFSGYQKPVLGYDLSELLILEKVLDNLKNGYITKLSHDIRNKVEGNRGAVKIKPVFSNYKNNVFSLVSALKSNLKNRWAGNKKTTTINEKIRRTGNYAIDVALNNFKNSDVYNTVLRDVTVSLERRDNELRKITTSVVDLIDSIPFKEQFTQNTLVRLIMLHKMRESDQSMPTVQDWIDSTMKSDTPYLPETMDKIQDLANSVKTGDDFDLQKAMDKLSPKGKKLLAEIEKIQEKELSPKVAFGSTVVRGSRVPVLEYYTATPRLTKGGDEKTAEEAMVKNYTNPSSRASTFYEKTKSAHAISFDAVESVLWSARHTLTDYHITPAVQKSKEIIKSLKKMDNWKGEKKDAVDSLESVFDDALEMVLGNSFGSESTTDKVATYVIQKSYSAMLGGIVRPSIDLLSNISYALLDGFDEFTKGVATLYKYKRPGVQYDAVFNLGSSQLNRMFNSGAGLKTRYADVSKGISYDPMREEVSGMRVLGKAVGNVNDTFDTFSNTTMSAPDQIVARTVYFGSLFIRFKELTGLDLDLDKVADNDLAYMEKYAEELRISSEFADGRVSEGFSSSSDFDGIMRNKKIRSDKPLTTIYKSFNSFMNKFLVSEYVTSVRAVNAMVGNGNISRVQGMKLLAAQTARMVTYSYLLDLVGGIAYSGISGAILAMRGLEAPEEEEEEIYDEEGNVVDTKENYFNVAARELGSVLAALAIDRNFGNVAKIVTGTSVEAINRYYGKDITYKGVYNEYEDNVVVPFFDVDKKPYEASTAEQSVVKASGPMSPYVRNAFEAMNYWDKARVAKTEKTKEKYEDRVMVSGAKLLSLVSGIPLYRDFNKIYQEVSYQTEKAKKNTSNQE